MITLPPTQPPARAFSMIELLVVMIIITIVSAVAAPRFAHSTERYRAEGAARQVLADLRLAQSTARSTGQNVSVSYDVANNLYAMPKVASPADPEAGTVVDIAADPWRVNLMAISFAGSPTVVFDGFGTAATSGWIMLAAGTQVRAVLVDAESGEISVAPEGWTP